MTFIYRILHPWTVLRGRQKASGLEKNGLWYPFLKSRHDFGYVHLGLFKSLLLIYHQCGVPCRVSLLPPGASLAKTAGDHGTHRLSFLGFPGYLSLS